ncbi:unnamed protein product [Ectocarpus fasciculatus]
MHVRMHFGTQRKAFWIAQKFCVGLNGPALLHVSFTDMHIAPQSLPTAVLATRKARVYRRKIDRVCSTALSSLFWLKLPRRQTNPRRKPVQVLEAFVTSTEQVVPGGSILT